MDMDMDMDMYMYLHGYLLCLDCVFWGARRPANSADSQGRLTQIEPAATHGARAHNTWY